jgi:hypothetical protein
MTRRSRTGCRPGEEGVTACLFSAFFPQKGDTQRAPGGVAARPVEAGDEAEFDRVAPGHKDDRHRPGCGLGREHRRGIADDQGDVPAKKVCHQNRQPVSLTLGRAILDGDGSILDPALGSGPTQLPRDCVNIALSRKLVRSHVVSV